MEVYFILLVIFLIIGYLTFLSVKRRLTGPVGFKDTEVITKVAETSVVETTPVVTHSDPVTITAELPVVQEPVVTAEPAVAESSTKPKKPRAKTTSSKPKAPRKSKKSQ